MRFVNGHHAAGSDCTRCILGGARCCACMVQSRPATSELAIGTGRATAIQDEFDDYTEEEEDRVDRLMSQATKLAGRRINLMQSRDECEALTADDDEGDETGDEMSSELGLVTGKQSPRTRAHHTIALQPNQI